ncbi:Ribosomal large subunit pseudouridine synthase D [Blochmannia endosymbiont of Polyrhachis (Hedomyrma) turneri]|nr:Ribosomal large subunit pseudouridine synthase D [Blochmannia endosymbiont of Polyrhachis (Hedomyrma) turneri]
MKQEHKNITKTIIITSFLSGLRLDKALSQSLPDHSRSRIKRWILNRQVKVNNCVVTMPDKKVLQGELIEISYVVEYVKSLKPENIFLNVVYEDDFIVIINKPSNLVVHPGVGNTSGTVLNALLYHYPNISVVPRAGIVQRLDKDTTGLMLIAKDIDTQVKLVKLFQLHKIRREYDAIVYGNIVNNGTIDRPIARNFFNRTSMCVHPSGKSAITHYQVIETFSHSYTRVRLQLETGRTHQIRVHMAHIQHPLIGDKKYGKSKHLLYLKKRYDRTFNHCCVFSFERQALHASMLKFVHPITGVSMRWKIPLPLDMLGLLNVLRLSL